MRLAVVRLLRGLNRPVVVPCPGQHVLDRESRALDLRLLRLGAEIILNGLQDGARPRTREPAEDRFVRSADLTSASPGQ